MLFGLLHIIFPAKCFECGKKNTSLCKECLDRTSKAVDTPYIWITSIYSFKDPLIKKAVHAIKYYHRKDLADPLTDALAKDLLAKFAQNFPSENSALSGNSNLETKNWILVPIPMPRFRKYLRGYNQAELIATSLSLKTGISYGNLLTRSRSPHRQVESETRSERLDNQKNSFKALHSVPGNNIILVDDVTTTGATLFEARKILLKAGAKEVQAVTLAH
jgi:competence protein ComFC